LERAGGLRTAGRQRRGFGVHQIGGMAPAAKHDICILLKHDILILLLHICG
jgi:hypothetical protein